MIYLQIYFFFSFGTVSPVSGKLGTAFLRVSLQTKHILEGACPQSSLKAHRSGARNPAYGGKT